MRPLKCAPVYVVVLGTILCAQSANNFGTFKGVLQFEPTGDGVHMKVLQLYSYTDADEHTLTADAGFLTDGASIPRALWTVVGSPFTGLYVGAAVIHDVGCDTHKYSWQITHRMFYTAMRSLGVDDSYAKLLYWGVRIGGPRWKDKSFTAGSIKDLKDTVGRAGYKMEDKLIRQERVYPASTNGGVITTYHYEVTDPLPVRLLNESDAKAIADYIKTHSDKPVSLEDIDKVTPLDLPLPVGAIPR